jgi:uncharacterized protein
MPALTGFFFTQERGEVVGLSGWGLALVFAPVLLVFLAALLHRRPSARESGLLYWTVAALVGGSLSVLALAYAGAMLVTAFLVTACAFGALSLWGYVTRRNLAGFGNFLAVALFGLIVALAANLLLRNSLFELALDVIGVLIFSGLIAADTRRLKLIYYQLDDPARLGAASNYGALSLYLNFINLFELLLSLMSGRSRR